MGTLKRNLMIGGLAVIVSACGLEKYPGAEDDPDVTDAAADAGEDGPESGDGEDDPGTPGSTTETDTGFGDGTDAESEDDADPDPDPDPDPETDACELEAITPLTVYHIGHSLTDRMADLFNHLMEAHTEESVSYAYKSISGASLWHHWDNPDDGRKGNMSGTPLGLLRQADVLSLTEATNLSYLYDHESRSSTEFANAWVDAFLESTSNPDPAVYIYSTWYGREVEGPDTDESIASFLEEIDERQFYWEALAQSVADAHPDLPVHIIPGDLVMKSLQEQVLAGTLTLPDGLTYRETFFKRNRPGRYGGCETRDYIHLGRAGIYAIAMAHYATIYGSCVIGLPASIPYRGYDDGCIEAETVDIDPDLALAIQQTVWSVVRDYAWSGVE